jgi:anti-sigma factor RsiW
MNQISGTFRCGDGEALVAFVYGESSPAEREAIANHIARCTACSDELEALGLTRQQLAAWVPPEQTLGFQITRSESGVSPETPSTGATILRPAAWWQQPLPAWAQMAAAVVIFASGMALGGRWSSQPLPAPTMAITSGAPAATTVSTGATTGVTREDLAAIEQRLRGEIAQVRTSATADPVTSADSRALMQRVNQLIAASEARQQNELELRTSVMTRDWANRRTLDLANIEQRLGSTSMRVLGNQQDINSIAQRVGYSPNYSQYVP